MGYDCGKVDCLDFVTELEKRGIRALAALRINNRTTEEWLSASGIGDSFDLPAELEELVTSFAKEAHQLQTEGVKPDWIKDAYAERDAENATFNKEWEQRQHLYNDIQDMLKVYQAYQEGEERKRQEKSFWYQVQTVVSETLKHMLPSHWLS